MCYNQSCLGYLLVAIIVGFIGLIYFSLKYRKIFLANNLKISADQIWEGVAERATQANFEKSDLLFSIYQDKLSAVGMLIFKNSQDQVVGRIECPLGSREYKMLVGQDEYRINFLLSGWKSACLYSAGSDSVLASFKTLNIFGKHKFDIPGVGVFVSKRPNLNLRIIFNYFIGANLVGISQQISPTRDIGRLVVLPSTIPLHLRMFFLIC